MHRGNDCSYTVCTEMVLQWHCLLNNVLCSTEIDCCSAFRHKLLDTERSVTSNTVKMEERIIGHSSGICLHTASCNQLSATFHVSVYTQLHVTNSHPQFSVYTQLHVTNSPPQYRSLSTQLNITSSKFLHNNRIYNLLSTRYRKQWNLKLYISTTIDLLEIQFYTVLWSTGSWAWTHMLWRTPKNIYSTAMTFLYNWERILPQLWRKFIAIQ